MVADVAAWVAAVAATLTLLLSTWTRYIEQVLRRTSVTAWSEPVNYSEGDLTKSGARVWVRNDTGVALQGTQVVVRPRKLSITRTAAGEPKWGFGSTPVSVVVPPHSVIQSVVPGASFMAWRGQMDHELVTEVIFQDALGKWWHRTAKGRVQPITTTRKYTDPPPRLDEVKAGRWRRRVTVGRFRHPG